MGKIEYTMTAIFTAIGALFVFIALSVESIVAKWIWGILAAAVFIFTIYAVIDAIVKSRRKPKDLADLLIEHLREESKKTGFADDFSKRMDEHANRRDKLYNGQQTEDDDYGYSMNNPVMTSTVSYSDKYLASLRTLTGQSFTWERNGSYCVYEISGVENVMVDKYQLFLKNRPYKVIYICPYGHNGRFAPKGLILKEEIDRICQEIQKIYPTFNLEKEKENPLYIKLLQFGISIQTAYEILHKEELLTKKATMEVGATNPSAKTCEE